MSTKGVTDLSTLIATMEPFLDPEEYVFCSVSDEQEFHAGGFQAFATCREPEGLSVVLRRLDAEQARLDFQGNFQRIGLTVHSSLDAVGLTASTATALAKAGISANVIAGRYHDHFFVPKDRAEEALEVLRQLSRTAQARD